METECSLHHPSLELKEAYFSFYKEWHESGEPMIPWVIQKDPSDFGGMIEFLQNNAKGINLPAGWVPDSTYWMTDREGQVVGVTNIRHALTEYLSTRGGHIGYGIRPSERRKGYATVLLDLSLKKAAELGISEALVVCDAVNTGSRKTILNNGGVRDEDFIEEDGNIINRYWIRTGYEKAK